MATKTVNEVILNKISVGGKAPKAIYKGSTEVKKVYKGSTLVYEKGDVTYTLTGSNSSCAGGQTSITFTVQSYKSSSTRVNFTTSNVSIISGSGASVSAVRTGSGTYSYVDITIPANNSYTSNVTYKIRVTQPTSGLTVDLTGTAYSKTAYLTLSKLGFRFSGVFPSSGFVLGVSNLVMGSGGTHYENFWGEDSSMQGYAIYNNVIDGVRVSGIDGNSQPGTHYGVVYWNNTRQNGSAVNEFTWGPRFKNGDTFSAAFYFGATWAGSSAYQGNTWYFHLRDLSSGKSYLKAATSSKYWEVGVQPAYIGVTTQFQNITADATVDLVADFNWSWDNSWRNGYI